MSIINNIPRDILDAIIEADKVGSGSFLKKDKGYINILRAYGYIVAVDTTDFDTENGYVDYGIHIIKPLK